MAFISLFVLSTILFLCFFNDNKRPQGPHDYHVHDLCYRVPAGYVAGYGKGASPNAESSLTLIANIPDFGKERPYKKEEVGKVDWYSDLGNIIISVKYNFPDNHLIKEKLAYMMRLKALYTNTPKLDQHNGLYYYDSPSSREYIVNDQIISCLFGGSDWHFTYCHIFSPLKEEERIADNYAYGLELTIGYDDLLKAEEIMNLTKKHLTAWQHCETP
ncbi:hypothetical protein [Gluconobacter wancherniae]|uniref:hypothetical protein n=1 Tax=Gluconobacter wancherniae TaxID=1307955 RepID=UPI001B8C5FC4|nr:hypothetical protein [Gluconobacter wancherniae]